MEWLAALVRSIGSSFPGASSLVQLNSEMQSRKVNQRLDRLEDPISSLHPEIQAVSEKIYHAVKERNSCAIEFDDDFYHVAARPLAALEADGALRGQDILGKRYAHGINIISPVYLLYMARLFESETNMSKLVELVDTCQKGKSLDGNQIAIDLNLPAPVVRSVFQIYHNKGFGLLSGEISANRYIAMV